MVTETPPTPLLGAPGGTGPKSGRIEPNSGGRIGPKRGGRIQPN